MKKILLFVLIILLFNPCLFAEEVVFPTSDAIWNVQINGQEHYYGLFSDTIIGDKTYSKLYLLNDTILTIDNKDTYVGGFRQEEKKVWYRPAYFEPWYANEELDGETLLYDFSGNVGDTIWHHLLIQGGREYMSANYLTASIIDDIKNVEGVNIYTISQYINDNGDLIPMMGRMDFWKEGIGSLASGLFWFLSNPPMSGGVNYHLACFKQGNEIKYMDKDCTSCFKYFSSNIRENIYSSIFVLLNKSQLSVRGEVSVFPCQIKLYNVLGQLRLSKIIYSDNESVNMPKETENVYLYRLIDKKDESILKTGKLIN